MDHGSPTTAERFLPAFRSRLRTYAAIVGITAVLAVGASLLLPNWYRAESTLLPPSESGESSFGLFAGMIQSSALSTLGLSTTSTPSDVFGEILKSRLLNVAAIQKFGLDKIYHRKGMDRTLKEFRRHLGVDVSAAGVLGVSFEDRDPVRAAGVANFLVAELDRFNVETYKTRGKRLREFLGGRVVEVRQELSSSEALLLAYERKHHVVSSADNEAVRGAADILSQKFYLETQRAYLSSFMGPGSSERASVERQLTALNSEIGKLPGIRQAGARLLLDVEAQRKLLLLIMAQYEDARMQETRDTPTVTILDVAVTPEVKARPSRSLIVLGAVVAALLGCVGWTLVSLSREP